MVFFFLIFVTNSIPAHLETNQSCTSAVDVNYFCTFLHFKRHKLVFSPESLGSIFVSGWLLGGALR